MIALPASLALIPNGTEKLALAFGFTDLGVYGEKLCETVSNIELEAKLLFPGAKLYMSFDDNIWAEYPVLLPNNIKMKQRLFSKIPLLYRIETTLFVLNARYIWEESVVYKDPEIHCYIRDKKLLEIARKYIMQFAKSWKNKGSQELFFTSVHMYLGFMCEGASLNRAWTPFISEILK